MQPSRAPPGLEKLVTAQQFLMTAKTDLTAHRLHHEEVEVVAAAEAAAAAEVVVVDAVVTTSSPRRPSGESIFFG